MTERIPLDELTSDAYDALYAELENLRLAVAGADHVSATWARKHREAEAERAALKRAHVALAAQAGKDHAAIERVRKLHEPQPDGTAFPDSYQCGTCSQNGGDGYQYLIPWPCPTVAALDEHQEQPPAVIEVTEGEIHQAAAAALSRLGITYAELQDQARRRDFTSPQAHSLWTAIGGTLNPRLLDEHQEQ